MAYESVADALVRLTFRLYVFNYADKPDLDMNELAALAVALGDRRARTFRISMSVEAGVVSDLAARLTGRRFPSAPSGFGNTGPTRSSPMPASSQRGSCPAMVARRLDRRSGTSSDRLTRGTSLVRPLPARPAYREVAHGRSMRSGLPPAPGGSSRRRLGAASAGGSRRHLRRCAAMRSALRPSQVPARGPSCRRSRDVAGLGQDQLAVAADQLVGASSMVIGRSVLVRSVRQGTPRPWSPPARRRNR